jgi:hypothetical protein
MPWRWAPTGRPFRLRSGETAIFPGLRPGLSQVAALRQANVSRRPVLARLQSGRMFPLASEIFVPIPGTGARVNLMAVILAVGVLVLLALLLVAILAMLAGSRRRDARH